MCREVIEGFAGVVEQSQVDGGAFSGVDLVVVVALRVVDLVGHQRQRACSHSLDGGQGIDTAKTRDVAFGVGKRNCGFLQNATDFCRRKEVAFAEHQRNGASYGRGRLRGAAHGAVCRREAKMQGLDAHTWGTQVGADEAYAGIVRVVAKLGVCPCDGTARGKISRIIIVVNGSNGDGTTQLARILHLNGIHIRRRATAGNAHVVWDGIHARVAIVAGGNGTHNARVQNGFAGVAQQSTLGYRGIRDAKRQAEKVASMFDGPFYASRDAGRCATAIFVQTLDTHQRSVRRDTCL